MEGPGRGGEESRMMESRYDDTAAHGKQADYLRMSTYGMDACNSATRPQQPVGLLSD